MATSTVPDGRLSLDTEYNGHFVYTARYVAATKGITPLEYVEELEANRELLLREVQRRDSSARLLDNGRTSIDGRPAFFQKVSGTQTRGTVITVYQLYFLLDANIYLFQMSSPTKVFPTAFEDFSRIIRTVEFRK